MHVPLASFPIKNWELEEAADLWIYKLHDWWNWSGERPLYKEEVEFITLSLIVEEEGNLVVDGEVVLSSTVFKFNKLTVWEEDMSELNSGEQYYHDPEY